MIGPAIVSSWRRPAALAWLVCAVTAGPASAQISVSGGMSWTGGYSIGASTAELRSNGLGAATAAHTWFEADSEVEPAFGAGVRVGVDVHPRLTIEGAATFARPRLGFSITGDSEAGPQALDGETLQEYAFEGGVLWHWPLRAAPRLVPFVAAGAGYLRQLHEERTLVESGQQYHAGGGIRYWLRGRPDSSRSLGLRADVRMNIRVHGIDFDNQTRVAPSLSLLLFVGL